ncbi:class I SAM-dependent methyltransferase [Nissabacter sp. SGAir0207]|uniref:class I SAM-dependent methyltransferase n=1 Tax=Nissabacter sp. SGAir0207 TaxID=2126321 RepID=UPI0010F65D7C|nr:class I SAM-dependent methyltransferase [Nissabacter sp. SGAir0207]
MKARVDYDLFARAYDADSQANLWNAHYERPEMLRLLGDGEGKWILDAGCGGGLLSQALQNGGARVSGIDSSGAMLAIARQRLGEQAELCQGDLNQPLPYADGQFDAVAASLVIHYVDDWPALAAEFARVLRPGGRLVISTHNPYMDHKISGNQNYLSSYTFDYVWNKGGVTCELRYWHRPLHAIMAPLLGGGLQLESFSEPYPAAEVQARFPDTWQKIVATSPFIFLVASRRHQ